MLLVAATRNALPAAKDRFVAVSEDSLAIQTPEPAAFLTLVPPTTPAHPLPNAGMTVPDLPVSAHLALLATPTQSALEANVLLTRIALRMKLAKTVDVKTLAFRHAEMVPTANQETMLPFASVQGEELEILSRAAESSRGARFAKSAESTPSVKFFRMALPSAAACLTSSATR